MWVQFDVHDQRIGKDETKQSQRHNSNSQTKPSGWDSACFYWRQFHAGSSAEWEAAALLACVTAVSPKSASSQYSRCLCLCVTKVTAVATGTCVCHQCHNITGAARGTKPKSLWRAYCIGEVVSMWCQQRHRSHRHRSHCHRNSRVCEHRLPANIKCVIVSVSYVRQRSHHQRKMVMFDLCCSVIIITIGMCHWHQYTQRTQRVIIYNESSLLLSLDLARIAIIIMPWNREQQVCSYIFNPFCTIYLFIHLKKWCHHHEKLLLVT